MNQPGKREPRRDPAAGSAFRRPFRRVIEAGSDIIGLSETVIRASSREHPADGVLRRELGNRHDLTPAEATEVSRSVFAFYRWFGWLDKKAAVRGQVRRAIELSERFAEKPESFPEAELIERAVPEWLKAEMGVSGAWARAIQAPPKVWLRAKRGQGKEVARKLGDCVILGEGVLGDTLEYRGRQDLFRTAEFHGGEFELQDVNSQVVALVCNPQPGETWWDACAGEGGKTLHFSELMQNKGLIWASDRALWRLEKLKRRAARAKAFNYRATAWDGGARAPTKTKFDGVLVDAPCSGAGTWQRNPHARWTMTPADARELSQLQQRILRVAAGCVKPGGRLVYAVCSLLRSETAVVTEAFENRASDFTPLAVANPLNPSAAPASKLWFWPQDCGGNGMFVAVWSRRGAAV